MYFKRLYDLRTDHDLTQKQVAEYLICHPKVYSRYERGDREIPSSMVIKLAKFYNTTTDYIFGLSDEMHK